MKRISKKLKGFTLIELVVVLAIISVIAAIALLTLNNIVQNSRQKVDESNISYLNSTTRIYKIETGNWPINANDLVPNYVKELPDSPTGGTYIYDVSTNEFTYSAP